MLIIQIVVDETKIYAVKMVDLFRFTRKFLIRGGESVAPSFRKKNFLPFSTGDYRYESDHFRRITREKSSDNRGLVEIILIHFKTDFVERFNRFVQPLRVVLRHNYTQVA
jgi:hypothetical protein